MQLHKTMYTYNIYIYHHYIFIHTWDWIFSHFRAPMTPSHRQLSSHHGDPWWWTKNQVWLGPSQDLTYKNYDIAMFLCLRSYPHEQKPFDLHFFLGQISRPKWTAQVPDRAGVQAPGEAPPGSEGPKGSKVRPVGPLDQRSIERLGNTRGVYIYILYIICIYELCIYIYTHIPIRCILYI